MTALYAILAVICLGGILMGAYLIGFDDGVTAEQMRHRTLGYIVQEVIEEAQAEENDRHALTHADMVQMEAAAKNNEKEKDNEDKNRKMR
jgi:hypothetical protein